MNRQTLAHVEQVERETKSPRVTVNRDVITEILEKEAVYPTANFPSGAVPTGRRRSEFHHR
jgi:hypothetical protein